MGTKYEAPTEAELEAMKGLVVKALKDGAFGLSTGLEYYPGLDSNTEELIEVAKVAYKHGGVYISHLRDEESVAQGGYGVLNAVAEAIKIGKQSGIPVEIGRRKLISQLKAICKVNWLKPGLYCGHRTHLGCAGTPMGGNGRSLPVKTGQD